MVGMVEHTLYLTLKHGAGLRGQVLLTPYVAGEVFSAVNSILTQLILVSLSSTFPLAMFCFDIVRSCRLLKGFCCFGRTVECIFR